MGSMALRIVPLLFVCLLMAACGKPASYEVALIEGETLNRGDTVYLEQQPVAKIVELHAVGDAGVAVIVMNSKDLNDKIVEGVVRTRQPNRIVLTKDLVKESATPLISGSLIPLREFTDFTRSTNFKTTAVIVSICLVIAVLLIFIAKNLLGMFINFGLLGLASVCAYFVFPHFSPYVQSAISRIGLQHTETFHQSEGSDGVVGKLGELLRSNPPDPSSVAFAMIAVTLFITLKILVGFLRK